MNNYFPPKKNRVVRCIEPFTFFPTIFLVSFIRRPLDFQVCVCIESVILMIVCESEKAHT